MPHSFSYAVSMNLEHSIKEGSHERYPDHFQCFFQAMTDGKNIVIANLYSTEIQFYSFFTPVKDIRKMSHPSGTSATHPYRVFTKRTMGLNKCRLYRGSVKSTTPYIIRRTPLLEKGPAPQLKKRFCLQNILGS